MEKLIGKMLREGNGYEDVMIALQEALEKATVAYEKELAQEKEANEKRAKVLEAVFAFSGLSVKEWDKVDFDGLLQVIYDYCHGVKHECKCEKPKLKVMTSEEAEKFFSDIFKEVNF